MLARWVAWLGRSPDEFWNLTLAEVSACFDAYRELHAPAERTPARSAEAVALEMRQARDIIRRKKGKPLGNAR